MKVAVIGQPGRWSTDRLIRALGDAGADVVAVDLERASLHLPDHRLHLDGAPLEGLDGAVVKKIGDTLEGWAVGERVNLLRHLEASGVPVLSRPARLEAALNRYRMTVELAAAGLPIPETVVTEDMAVAEAAINEFGVAVLKPLYTSKGRGMQRLHSGPDLRPALETHVAEGFGPFYVQRFIEHPGRDLGVAVLEGRALGAYWRVAAESEWMTTVLSGGRYEAADPPAAVIDMAVRAAEHFGLFFTGVDLMESPGGQWVVLEVSAFGGYRGLLTACGVDAAVLVAKSALRAFGTSGERAP